ncbi:MAG TPA: cytosine permease [Vicinamibacterales bacterium]|nr:cytosine permease [Vicinamibacterales bacterium]
MRAADLTPVAPDAQTQSGWDLFLIFAAANIVATTLQVGAALGGVASAATMTGLVCAGAIVGAGLVAVLAPVGSRLGVPSMVAARAVLGHAGAAVAAMVLFVTNFAWIAVNNVIAASVCARLVPLPLGERGWALVLGLVSTAVVARGPAAVRRADRWAVPLMVTAGLAITWAVVGLPAAPAADAVPATVSALPLLLDVVIGYQVSWLLMFADYSRFTRASRASAWAVFLGLGLTALWLMPLGWRLARHAGSADPGAMLGAADVGVLAAVLITLATLTTNFVNVYLSSLAWRSVMPAVPDTAAVWIVGLVGTALGAASGAWLDRFAGFMTVVGSVLVPVGGVLIAHFVLGRRATVVADLYNARGGLGGVRWPGLGAWAGGITAYYALPAWWPAAGATVPSLAVAVVLYVLLDRPRPTGHPSRQAIG